MQALFALGGVSDAIARIERYAVNAGRHVYSAFQRIVPFFADPKKGIPVSIAAVKLLSLTHVNADSVTQKIDEFVTYLERLDLPTLLCGYSGCINPPAPFQVDWNVINEAVPDLQCGFGDVGCYIQNGFRAVARAVAGAFYGLGSTLFWLAWNVANVVVISASRLMAFVIKFIAGNVAKFMITVWNGIVDALKRMFCLYITYVAPAISIYRGVRSFIEGDKLPGLFWLMSPIIPIALVSGDCGIAGMPQVPPTPSQPVTASPEAPSYSTPSWYKPQSESINIVEGVAVVLASRTVRITDIIDVRDYNIGM